VRRSRFLPVLPIAFCTLILFGAISVWTAQPAYACSCVVPPPPQEALDDADDVFAGEVIDITPLGTGTHLTVRYAVSDTWKGADSAEIEVQTPGDSAACGYEFQEGEEYLVYTYENERNEGPGISTGLCQRTTELSNADEDIEALGESVTVPATGAGPGNDGGAGDEFGNWSMAAGIGLILALLRWLRQ
jgi:hypothetical protein